MKKGDLCLYIEYIQSRKEGVLMARYFGDELKQQILDANDIVSVLSEHLALKKKGQNYWACCPFHGEKTPSFSVRPDKGYYHCFGCGASGNVITFLMNYEHLTFPEAMERLAHRANIPLPEEEMSPAQRAREAHRQKLYEVNALAESFFHSCLVNTEMGKVGLTYFKQRGLQEHIIEQFHLGFAPDGGDRLYRAFKERGIEDSIMLELNLVRKNDKGQFYDFFRNRVMFPIRDGRGRVIGFGGRIMGSSDHLAKYMNSPESPIFDKGKNLFAFDQAYKSIRATKQAILVEGYMDVISAHAHGVTNVVASLGTAYTKDHGKLLMRQAEEIVLAYDMDGAGQKAARRALDLLQNTDFRVRVLAMPDGKDPDDYCRNHGGPAFQNLIAQAIKPFDYLLNASLVAYDLNTKEGKEAVLSDVFPYIAHEENQVKREDMLTALAMPLWLDMTSIRRYFREFCRKGDIHMAGGQSEPTIPVSSSTDEDILLAAMMENEALFLTVMQNMGVEEFTNPIHRDMVSVLYECLNRDGQLLEEVVEKELSPDAYREYARLMVIDHTSISLAEAWILVATIRLKNKRDEYTARSLKADQLNRAGDSAFLVELKKCQEIQKEIGALQAYIAQQTQMNK